MAFYGKTRLSRRWLGAFIGMAMVSPVLASDEPTPVEQSFLDSLSDEGIESENLPTTREIRHFLTLSVAERRDLMTSNAADMGTVGITVLAATPMVFQALRDAAERDRQQAERDRQERERQERERHHDLERSRREANDRMRNDRDFHEASAGTDRRSHMIPTDRESELAVPEESFDSY